MAKQAFTVPDISNRPIMEPLPGLAESIAAKKAELLEKTKQGKENNTFLTMRGLSTENVLYLSNSESMNVVLASTATYADFSFLGKPEKYAQFEHSETNDITLTFDLLATVKQNDVYYFKKNIWHADFVSDVNNMSVSNVYFCANWLISTTKPQKNKDWQPPERIVLYVAGFVTSLVCVVTNASKTIKEVAGYEISADGNSMPKCITMNLTLRPIFDLDNAPFAEDIAQKGYDI